MDRKNLDRYKRILLEKRGEMSVPTAEAESPFRLREDSGVIQLTKLTRMQKRNFRSTCIKPMSAFCEQSKRPLLELNMERLAPARPAEIQFLGPA